DLRRREVHERVLGRVLRQIREAVAPLQTRAEQRVGETMHAIRGLAVGRAPAVADGELGVRHLADAEVEGVVQSQHVALTPSRVVRRSEQEARATAGVEGIDRVYAADRTADLLGEHRAPRGEVFLRGIYETAVARQAQRGLEEHARDRLRAADL